jgi:hypothetical protein
MSLREDGIRAFGAWEMLGNRLRGGIDPAGCRIEDDFAWEHTEVFIKGLKARGFNLFITHFSKGYGISAEAEDREKTRTIVRLCRKHGMYAGGYLRYTNFIPETFKRDDPKCIEHMAAVGSRGHPRYGTQYYRFMPCPSSPEFMAYLDRLIGIGIEDIGLDLLHVDGMNGLPEPHACRCPRCVKSFHEWLSQRYPTAKAQSQRFGFAPIDHVEIPDFAVEDPPAPPLPLLTDPVTQEWMFFRCHLLARAWKFIVGAARRRNPDCYIQGNLACYPELNPFWFYTKDLALLAEAKNDGFFTEETTAPELWPDGRLHGQFETFKKLRRLGIQVFTYNREPTVYKDIVDPERLKRAMAHQMAFNLDSAGVFVEKTDQGKWPTVVPEYMAFHRNRRDLFRGVIQAHDVAIYYSERNYSLNCGTPLVTQNLTRDVLLRNHVPFGYLLDAHRREMKTFRAMVLPEVESMSEAEAADIAAYVRSGGGILILGANTGKYDEFRRLHRQNPLASRLGVKWNDHSSGFAVRAGKGRVAFLPQLVAPEGTPEDLAKGDQVEKNRYFYIVRPERWRLPTNAADLLRLLDWTAGGYRFVPLVPNTVVVEFGWQQKTGRYLIHLVNFDLEHEVGPFEIRCGVVVKRAQAFSPDGKAPRIQMTGSRAGSGILQINGFHRYMVIAAHTGAVKRK